MGCHTWVYKRDYEFELQAAGQLKQRLISYYQKLVDMYSKPSYTKYDFDTPMFRKERISYYTRYIAILKKYDWKRSTLIKHCLHKHMTDEPLRIMYDGHIYKDSCVCDYKKQIFEGYHDPFRYYQYDSDVYLTSAQETWDFFSDETHSCEFYYEDDDTEWQRIYVKDATKKQLEYMKKKIFDMFDDLGGDVVIKFG